MAWKWISGEQFSRLTVVLQTKVSQLYIISLKESRDCRLPISSISKCKKYSECAHRKSGAGRIPNSHKNHLRHCAPCGRLHSRYSHKIVSNQHSSRSDIATYCTLQLLKLFGNYPLLYIWSSVWNIPTVLMLVAVWKWPKISYFSNASLFYTVFVNQFQNNWKN